MTQQSNSNVCLNETIDIFQKSGQCKHNLLSWSLPSKKSCPPSEFNRVTPNYDICHCDTMDGYTPDILKLVDCDAR